MRKTSGFTVVELICLVALLGCLAAVVIPAFEMEERRKKTVEATMNLRRLYDATVSYYEGSHDQVDGRILALQFTAAVDWTPRQGACCQQPGGKCAPNVPPHEGPWNTWDDLNFGIDEPFYYSYRTVAAIGDGSHVGDEYHLQATGDLDCNGTYSLYQRTATVDAELNISGGAGLVILNDIE
jgi:type II secretory pathway pseudopilin PulG